ncbi:hypothetical protein AGMMS49543_18500 [Betaproteobacteria bacterium]|nr:hypothetical protein AGMMS49543_18500 [Betaproteobacteria bacterium]GHU22178.1 hypothetical protein AGMMS50243_21260 [Betaproteobacteria bacterium]
MKKKFLAVNVALALGAMVVGSAAYAQSSAKLSALTVADPITATAQSIALPGNVVVSDDHQGLINVVPYYSVQGGNTVALSITNNDTLNGKVVKVRFRGAEWSDDALDFQVFLSPGDIWTASVTRDLDADGKPVAKLNWSGDTTVTRPFLDASGAQFHNDYRVAGEQGSTLEGYVEIITLADIPPRLNGATGSGATAGQEFDVPTTDAAISGNTNDETHVNPLYTAIKHVKTASGKFVPPAWSDSVLYDATIASLIQDSYWKYPAVGKEVTATGVAATNGIHLYQVANPAFGQDKANGAVWSGKSQFGASAALASDDWLQFPTPAISSYVTVINVQSRKAYTLQATALRNGAVVEGVNVNANNNAVEYYTTKAVSATGNAAAPVTDDANGAIKAYFAQYETDVAWGGAGERITADKIFGEYLTNWTGHEGAWSTSGSIKAHAGLPLYELDLPDLSTPTTASVAGIGFAGAALTAANIVGTAAGVYPGGAAAAQRDLVAAALQSSGYNFEYVTDKGLSASTDIVFNQPVRRYYYWYTKLDDASTAPGHRVFTNPAGKYNVYGEINTPYDVLRGESNSIVTAGYAFNGREEELVEQSSTGGSTWSPKPPVVKPAAKGLIGEVSILAINGSTDPLVPSGALDALLTKNAEKAGAAGYENGWGTHLTATTGTPPTGVFVPTPTSDDFGFSAGGVASHALLKSAKDLPFIAYTAINVYSPASNAVYGTTLPVRKQD